MKPQNILLGAIGFLILILWGITYAIICWTFTGEAFPNG
jgi:hypothetical protein